MSTLRNSASGEASAVLTHPILDTRSYITLYKGIKYESHQSKSYNKKLKLNFAVQSSLLSEDKKS
jgi:hypothetical protein